MDKDQGRDSFEILSFWIKNMKKGNEYDVIFFTLKQLLSVIHLQALKLVFVQTDWRWMGGKIDTEAQIVIQMLDYIGGVQKRQSLAD